ncbi:uncharacterized protein LOC124440644 isoform X2 [Xenia sp. Carnegie-2017]|uniref:uncharacterized protein LOC124440644 isoform X2 n=1 Tax=Xenia sp. Carnegie-2017 TaxID=2897299 RepID=UPI001F033072|nr:uncharacterized protein LOC124440644 isoform X2 [Xenia sp. Carnegie-2017]
MNSFFNIFGNKAPKNCKVDLENETDVVDENGFVWVNDETEYVGCRSERSTVSEKISKERVENFQKEVPSNRSEDLSCNNQDAGLLRPAQLSLSNVNDIPMTLSLSFVNSYHTSHVKSISSFSF